MKTKLLLSLTGCACALVASQAAAATLSVEGLANIYGSGHAVAPDPDGGGGGILPPSYSFGAGPGQVLTFDSVVGEVWCYWTVPNGPDGGPFASGTTDILPWGGISGIKDGDHTMFLVGLFNDGTEPADPAPATLDFTGNENFATLAPDLNQVFYIGDGLTGTGSGAVQQFVVPATATTLYLGFADAYDFGNPTDPPGCYNDNGGTLRATFRIQGQGVPDAGSSLALLSGAVLLLGALGRRLRK
jgi:hypothetical protein